MGQEELALLVTVKGMQEFSKNMQSADKDIAQTGKAWTDLSKTASSAGTALEKSTSSFGATAKTIFGDVVGVIKNVGTAIGVFAVTFNKAMAFGEAGANVAQMRQSFAGMGVDLDELRARSNGTISDFKLMSSTMTLLTGATGQVRDKLADVAPAILSIAKAAAKANPALGDTQFLYQSLMTGLKRGSPLLIDNAGLTLKVGRANEAYAASIGKTVDQLSAEEKIMALVNATLEAGDTLIQQVGGSTDSLADSFGRLRASVQNIGDSIKADLSPFLSQAASGLETLLTWNDRIRDAFAEQEDRLVSTSESYSEYIARVYEMVGAVRGAAIEDVPMLTQAEFNAAKEAQALDEATAAAVAELAGMRAGLADMPEALKGYGGAAREAADANLGLATSASKVADSFGKMEFDDQSLWKMAAASGASVSALSDLAQMLGIATDDEIQASIGAYRVVEAFGAGKISAEEFDRQMAIVAGTYDWATINANTYTQAMIQSGQVTANTATVIDEESEALRQNAQASGEVALAESIATAERQQYADLTAAATTAIVNATGATVELTQRDIEATLAQREHIKSQEEAKNAAANLQQAMLLASGALGTVKENADLATDALNKIPREIKINVQEKWERVGGISDYARQAAEQYGTGIPAPGRQAGGRTFGGPVRVGETGSEVVIPPPLSLVIPNRAANAITNNFNLTTQSINRPGSLVQEFGAMEFMATR